MAVRIRSGAQYGEEMEWRHASLIKMSIMRFARLSIMKTCSKCKQEKTLDSFGKRTREADGLQRHCKQCRSEYQKRWYNNDPLIQQERVRRSYLAKVQPIREYVVEYLSTHPCIDCGETDPVVLDFDHRDPSRKKFGIGQAISAALVRCSMEELIAEIAKCDVRCANDHRRRTATQFNWWRLAV